MTYAEYLHERCKTLGIENHIYMDARGMEHMICLTEWRIDGNEAEGIDHGSQSDVLTTGGTTS